ncbi:Holliday junction branch migration protein RuvA [Rhodospirillaceae bacterium KN72]|uniref:Holliday junction branch migration complex subunit RuvA n=1 Tax=Pacificispira spongiicola TaxID=2729598 RepID=A0A7Y0DWL0_9PROT|nr:Holliday junction branch migration protein RuvA [Pacificispira spongiicola]NMM42944.1 Holliday junction branch migration protein RuvA [Pacificispira spongiicola]
MFARLKGLLDEVGEDTVIVDVGGVGYLVYCSSRTLGALPGIGEAVRLEIETHVREDHIHLYGFLDKSERDWFRLLTTVQGVGARVGLAILSVLAPDALTQAVAAQDKAAVARANGVGPKLAQRIVSELKDKVGGMALGPVASAKPASGQAAPADAGATEDAVSALVNLGYGRSDAFTAVAKAARSGEGSDVSSLIRLALRELGR